MSSAALRWSGWAASAWGRPGRSDAAILALSLAGAALAAWLPLVAVLLACAAALLWLVWARPQASLYVLVVLMGSVKVNYYAGFFTFFPEYLVIMAAGTAWFLRWSEGSRRQPEPRLSLLFAAWIGAGLLSCVFAPMMGKVFVRVVLMSIVAVITLLVVDVTRTRGILLRALAVFEISAALFAVYGIVQMIGLVAGFGVNIDILEKYANPDMILGVGAPLRLRIGNIFRANAFFNDPNILAGYLAAAMCVTFALRAHHARLGRHGRAAAESLSLALMGLCLLLTMSRSGMVGLAAGGAVILFYYPAILRRQRFWWSLAAVLVGAWSAALAVHIDPILLVQRMSGSFDTGDLSNRTHVDVFFFGLRLLARHPFTGGGLGNFATFYSGEVDPYSPGMMTHCAPLTYFAESGLPGGIAFLALAGVVAYRAWSIVRDRGMRARDPELHAVATALLAAVLAIDVANLFYDYYLRTFVWVLSGLAAALPNLRSAGQPSRP